MKCFRSTHLDMMLGLKNKRENYSTANALFRAELFQENPPSHFATFVALLAHLWHLATIFANIPAQPKVLLA